jgi:hypothetical protein
MNKKEFVGAFISENVPFVFSLGSIPAVSSFSYGGDIARERVGCPSVFRRTGSSTFAFRLGHFR